MEPKSNRGLCYRCREKPAKYMMLMDEPELVLRDDGFHMEKVAIWLCDACEKEQYNRRRKGIV